MGEQPQSSALKDITFGSAAGMTAKVFEHPFDLIKVRLQSQPTDRALSYTGPLDCLRQTVQKEGWKGLYRGLSAPLVGAAFENATLFLVYNKCQDLIIHLDPLSTGLPGLSEKAKGKRRELRTPELALAAAGAGAAASFVLTPIELIKCKMQVQLLAREGAFGANKTVLVNPLITTGSKRRSFHSSIQALNKPSSSRFPPLQGPISLIFSTIRQNGLRGLWLGQTGTLFRETGGSSAWFTTYELSTQYFLSRRQRLAPSTSTSKMVKSDLPTYQLMLSGALAGMTYNIVLFPADSVKSAMQTWSELHPDKPRLNFWQMGRRIWNGRGLRGLYAGCGLTVMRSAPSSAMIFGIYETLEGKFGSWFV